MIKLVTQFDNEKSKLSLATPTCGCCCCCCCCCIVSTFATASISARNFGNYVAENLPNEPKKIETARNFGFWLPLGLLISLGLGLWLAAMIDLDVLIVLIPIGIMYLYVTTSSLKKKINLSGITSRVVFISILLVAFETMGFYVGAFALMYLHLFYLAGAIIISVLLICWAFRKKYDNLEKAEINDNSDEENSSNNQPNEVIDNAQTMKINNNNNNNNSDSDNNLSDTLVQEELSPKIQPQKKNCPNCGGKNAIDNKICIYCSNYFEMDDEK